MERSASKNATVNNRQFWQQHNKPIELWSSHVIEQKLNYIHMNPVVSGFVNEPEYWKYSSVMDYAGGRGLIEINYLF